ncbi:MAG TPA: glucose 1-dehydrogenase [Candidatus Methylomirabilis sp.]|nr:glucose 1-dehydrogenase [Candidatus Methylomirabilis sp.]
MKLTHKVALVTGGGRGIGRAIVEALAREGTTVAINYHESKDGAVAAMEAIHAGNGRAMIVQADVSAEPAAHAMVRQVVDAYGGIDILVNNAGVNFPAPFLQITGEQFRRVLEVNVAGVFYASQATAKSMVARGTGGCILNVSSLVATRPFANAAHYNASKAAVSALTQSMALELGTYRIRVNEICPASVETDMVRPALKDPRNLAHRLATIPLGRIGQPEDLAGAVVFLCSEEASWLTGASLVTDGGLSVIPPFGRPA